MDLGYRRAPERGTGLNHLGFCERVRGKRRSLGRAMARLSVLRRGAAAVLLLASAVRCAKPRSSGFAADLASVAEGDAHHGYAAGAEAAELFSLGSPAAAGAALSSGHSLAQLRGEDRRARAQSVSARAAIERSQHEGSAEDERAFCMVPRSLAPISSCFFASL